MKYLFKMACWDTEEKKFTNQVNLTIIAKTEDKAQEEAKRTVKRTNYKVTDIYCQSKEEFIRI